MAEQSAEKDALAKIRALAESDGMINRCETHGAGPTAHIASNCDWCAAFGIDQDWREALLRILNGGYPEQVTPPASECDCGHPSGDHDDQGACQHLCDCAWPEPNSPPGETT